MAPAGLSTQNGSGSETENLSAEELVRLGAVDSEFYARTFFPKTIRQGTPSFHKSVWYALEDPSKRRVVLVMFRGSAKTTLLRVFTSKRIAYGISKTILYVGASESHAVRSIRWLRTQVDRNHLWASTFGLRAGQKWQEHEAEIYNDVDESPAWILGVGITGNIRGINFDDYRPDLIILDDVITDENAATEEQRNKINDLIHGAVANSLISAVEEPNAKLAMLQTPQHNQDACSRAMRDERWHSVFCPCWTDPTMDLPVEQQESAWPEMFPTEELHAEKQSAIFENRLSVFAREMECKLVPPEQCSFRPEWLTFYDTEMGGAPQGCHSVLAIDPVPPPSERQMQKALKGKDYEAIVVWGRKGGKYFLLDCAVSRGHQPGWTVAKTFEFALKYRVTSIVVHSQGYERALKGIIEQEMHRRQIFFAVIPIDDRRAKITRILAAFSGIGPQGLIHCDSKHTEFIEQFSNYGPTYGDYDDVLDASATALEQIKSPYLELGADDYGEIDSSNIPKIPFRRAAP